MENDECFTEEEKDKEDRNEAGKKEKEPPTDTGERSKPKETEAPIDKIPGTESREIEKNAEETRTGADKAEKSTKLVLKIKPDKSKGKTKPKQTTKGKLKSNANTDKNSEPKEDNKQPKTGEPEAKAVTSPGAISPSSSSSESESSTSSDEVTSSPSATSEEEEQQEERKEEQEPRKRKRETQSKSHAKLKKKAKLLKEMIRAAKAKKAKREQKRLAKTRTKAKTTTPQSTRGDVVTDEPVPSTSGTSDMPGRRQSSGSDSPARRDWKRERERSGDRDSAHGRIMDWQNNLTMSDRDTQRERASSPCPSVAIERVIVRNPLTIRREEEKRDREAQREQMIEKEKLRLRSRVEDIFPGSRMITGVLTDSRWCTPCKAFNLGQCQLTERQHSSDFDKQVRHTCSICHFAAGVCNAHTARNCKLERFLDHEVERRREERRHQLLSQTEDRDHQPGRTNRLQGMAPPAGPSRNSRGRLQPMHHHPYARHGERR